MADVLDYKILNKDEQIVYNKIVDFGRNKNILDEDINIVIIICFVESRFNQKAKSGTGPLGLFQFGSGRWKDICSKEIYSYSYYDAWKILRKWGYKKKDGTNFIFDRKNGDHQIAVFYAELNIFLKEFSSENRSKLFSQEWKAYDSTLKALEKNAVPKTKYEKKALFVEAAHHGPEHIKEIVAGWKNKAQPNLKSNLEFLKTFNKKTTLLWDETDVPDPYRRFQSPVQQDGPYSRIQNARAGGLDHRTYERMLEQSKERG